MSILAPPLQSGSAPESEDADFDESDYEGAIIHGWRTVKRREFDGQVCFIEMPLTARDVLHPRLGDEIMYSSAHQNIFRYLGDVCIDRTGDSENTLVLTDTGVNLDLPEVATISPDIAVIPNVREPKKKWTVFWCGEEKTKPNLMIEITSPHRRENDTELKFDYYFRAQIPCYVIVDLANSDPSGIPPLLGYEWTNSGFQPMKTDERGRLWLPAIRGWLEAKSNAVVCYDENDVLIPEFPEVRKAAREAEEKAREAEERTRNAVLARQTAEAQLQQLQAEPAQLRGEVKTP